MCCASVLWFACGCVGLHVCRCIDIVSYLYMYMYRYMYRSMSMSAYVYVYVYVYGMCK